jgi:hypothetical protein
MMEGQTNVAVNAAGSSQGLAPTMGQATEASASASTPVAEANSQTPQATPSEQTPGQSGTPKALFNDLPSAERDYKALQAEYTKSKQALAELGDLKAIKSQIALMKSLQGDTKFREWAQARLAESETGSGDPETVKALEIVRQVAQREAQQMVAPLAAQAQAARMAATLQAMDRKHPEWREHQEQIRDGLVAGIQEGIFPQSVIHNMSLPFLEKLYAMTVGLDDDHAAKRYAKKLAQKQAASTSSTPGSAPTSVATGPISTIRDAFAAAQRSRGVA